MRLRLNLEVQSQRTGRRKKRTDLGGFQQNLNMLPTTVLLVEPINTVLDETMTKSCWKYFQDKENKAHENPPPHENIIYLVLDLKIESESHEHVVIGTKLIPGILISIVT